MWSYIRLVMKITNERTLYQPQPSFKALKDRAKREGGHCGTRLAKQAPRLRSIYTLRYARCLRNGRTSAL